MLELKIIQGANHIYRGLIRLGLRSVNARDKRALKKLDSEMDHAATARMLATNLHIEANDMEDRAQVEYTRKQRKINAAYNALENALEDAGEIV